MLLFFPPSQTGRGFFDPLQYSLHVSHGTRHGLSCMGFIFVSFLTLGRKGCHLQLLPLHLQRLT